MKRRRSLLPVVACCLVGCSYAYEDDVCTCPPPDIVQTGSYATAGSNDTGSFVHARRARTLEVDRAARSMSVTWTDTAGRIVIERWGF